MINFQSHHHHHENKGVLNQPQYTPCYFIRGEEINGDEINVSSSDAINYP